MSTVDIKDAADKMKNVHKDMVLWENQLAAIQQKVTDLQRQRETLQKQIDDKVSNANIVMSEQRAKIETERAFVQSEREKLESGKKEIALQIDKLRDEKAAFQKEKDVAGVQLAIAKQAKTNVDQFIITVQRAFTVLGG